MAGAGVGSPGGYTVGPAGSGGYGTSVEESQKLGHRMNALVRAFPSLGEDPNIVLALASGPSTDDEMFAQATNAVGASQMDATIESLGAMPEDRARAAYNDYPKAMQDALRASGYEPPAVPTERKGNWFNINLPDKILGLDTPDEISIGGSGVGVLGQVGAAIGAPLEAIQHGGGEVFEGGLEALNKSYRFTTHLDRTMSWLGQKYEGGILTHPSEFLNAWEATSNGPRTFRVDALDEVAEYLSTEELEVARIVAGDGAFETDPEGNIADYLIDTGVAADSPEFAEGMQRLYELQSDPKFQKAVEKLSKSKISFGRDIAHTWGLDPTEGLGAAVSGAFDGAASFYTDPFLLFGKARNVARAAKWGVGIQAESTLEGVTRMQNTWRKVIVEGAEASRTEVAQARGLNEVVERINRHFGQGDVDIANLGRELPQLEPEFDNLQRFHEGAKLAGEADLSTPKGVFDYLKTQAGLQGLASRRLGGFKQRYVEMPHLTRSDLTWLRGKRFYQETLDSWLESGIRPDGTNLEHLGLTEGVGRLVADRLMVPAARLVHTLTHHVPYENTLKLHGPEALTQFRRMTEMGALADMPRWQVDKWFNDFANSYNPATRRVIAKGFLDDFFGRSGVLDTPDGKMWAETFTRSWQQAYGHAGRDAVGNSRYGVWVDSHHAEAMMLPNLRGGDNSFMRHTQKVNLARATVGRISNSWFDAALGRYWKPAVLLRIGFITRAAGEELLNFVLRLSPSEYAQAKFLAPWANLTPDQQEMAVLRPFLFMSDTAHRISRYYKPESVLTRKINEFDQALLGVSHLFSGDLHQLANRFHMPTRSGIGRAFTDDALRAGSLQLHLGMTRSELVRMTPDEIAARRLLVYGEAMKDPVVARAFAEAIGGSTWEPMERRSAADSLMTILYPEGRGSSMRRVALKVKRGTMVDYDQTAAEFKRMYAMRLDQLRQDRVGRELLKVMQNYSGPKIDLEFAQMVRRRGISITGIEGQSAATSYLRMKVNTLGPKGRQALRDWAYEGDEQAYAWLLDHALDPDLRVLVEELPNLSRRSVAFMAETGTGPLIRGQDDLAQRLQDVARARMHDPDMVRHVREAVAANVDATGRQVARPPRDGFTPLYVPAAAPLDPQMQQVFGSDLAEELHKVGRPDMVDKIDLSDPYAAYTDPNVARAITRALGGREINRVDLPDEAIRRAMDPNNPYGLSSNGEDWHRAGVFHLPTRYHDKAELVEDGHRVPQVQVRGEYHDEWIDDAEYTETLKIWHAGPPEGHIRLYRGQAEDAGAPAVNVKATDYDMHRQETVGMWWTDQVNYAHVTGIDDRVRRLSAVSDAATEPQGVIYFVDVPKDQAKRFWLGEGSTADPEDLASWRDQAGGITDREWVMHEPEFIAHRRRAPFGVQKRGGVPRPSEGHTRVWLLDYDDEVLGTRTSVVIDWDEEQVLNMGGFRRGFAYDVPDTAIPAPQSIEMGDVYSDTPRMAAVRRWIEENPESGRGVIEIEKGPGRIIRRAEGSGAPQGEAISDLAGVQRSEFLDLVTAGSKQQTVRTAQPGLLDEATGAMVAQPDLEEVYEGFDAMHEITGRLLRGEFSIEDLAMLPEEDLPAIISGPQLYSEVEGRWDKIVRYGFDRVLGPAISSIIREPLFIHNFAKGMRNTRWVEPLLRDTVVQDEARTLAQRVFGEQAKVRVTAGTAPHLELVAGPGLNEGMVKGLSWPTADSQGRAILKDLSINVNDGRQVHLFDEDGIATDWLLDHQDEVVARLSEKISGMQPYHPEVPQWEAARDAVRLAGGPAERGEVAGQVDIFQGIAAQGTDAELSQLVDAWFTMPAWARDPKTGAVRANRELAKAMGWKDPTLTAMIEPSVVETTITDSTANARYLHDTRTIEIDVAKMRERWDRGLTNPLPDRAARQAEIWQRQGVEVAELQKALGSFEDYKTFVIQHEMAHAKIRRAGASVSGVDAEVVANELAFRATGYKQFQLADDDTLRAVADQVDAVVRQQNAGSVRALEQARAAGTEPPNPFDLSRQELKTLRRFAENDRHVREVIRDTALQRAMTDSIPFIDDHKVRSQFQEYVGNLIPFHFAEEQFLKRWVRSLSASPELIRKAQLYMNGIRNMGFITTNEFGEEVFVMPGSSVFTEAIGSVAKTLTGNDGMLPVPVPLTFQVQYMTPGFDRMGVPSFGPYVGVAVNGLRRLFPELAPMEEALMGPRGSGQSIAAYFVPTQMRRAYHALTDDPMEGEMHSAALEAAAYLEAHGLAPRDNASEEEVEIYLDRLTDHARIIGLTRAMVGFLGPTTPGITNPEDLNPEFVGLLRSGVPINEAVGKFLDRNPDANAYTVFRSESTTGGTLPATEEAMRWMTENDRYLRTFSAAAPWLIPQAESDDAYDRRAYYDQLGRGLRIRKTPKDWYLEVKASKGADTYYDMRDEYEERLAAAEGNPVARREIEQTWRTWKGGWLAQHPALAQRLRGDPTSNARRQETLSQMRLILSDPGAPETPHGDALRGLLVGWFRFHDDYLALRHDRRGVAIDMKRQLRDQFVDWAKAYARKNRGVSAFFNSVLRPELGLLGAESEDLVLTS